MLETHSCVLADTSRMHASCISLSASLQCFIVALGTKLVRNHAKPQRHGKVTRTAGLRITAALPHASCLLQPRDLRYLYCVRPRKCIGSTGSHKYLIVVSQISRNTESTSFGRPWLADMTRAQLSSVRRDAFTKSSMQWRPSATLDQL